MAKLVLKEFTCVVDTDELGSESPYFITLVGDVAKGDAKVKITRQGNWHNEVDKGEKWIVNETVDSGFSPNSNQTLVLVAMVEEDEGLDVSGSERAFIESKLNDQLNDLKSAGVNQITGSIRDAISNNFVNRVSAALSSAAGANDDLLGIKRLQLNGAPGAQPPLKFTGGNGDYRVKFAIE